MDTLTNQGDFNSNTQEEVSGLGEYQVTKSFGDAGAFQTETTTTTELTGGASFEGASFGEFQTAGGNDDYSSFQVEGNNKDATALYGQVEGGETGASAGFESAGFDLTAFQSSEGAGDASAGFGQFESTTTTTTTTTTTGAGFDTAGFDATAFQSTEGNVDTGATYGQVEVVKLELVLDLI